MSLLSVNIPRRYALSRAHTATHLLHAVLVSLLPDTKQAGSYVGEDELRFDFYADDLFSDEQLTVISNKINTAIYNSHPVTTAEMSYEQALESGAKAFFEEKYPEIVRVVSILSPDLKSIELCGGTHVSNTSHIGGFVIVEQTTVAAGIKRISALTSPKLAQHFLSLQTEKKALADKVGVPVKQLDAKIDKILTENDSFASQVQKLSTSVLQSLVFTPGSLGDQSLDILCHYDSLTCTDSISFSMLVSHLRSTQGETSWLVYNDQGQFAFCSPDAKSFLREKKIRGGGSDSFVQGKDKNIKNLL